MSSTLMFVCSDAEKYGMLAQPMQDAGFDTEMVDPGATTVLETIETAAPMATVFDLATGPEQAMQEIAKAMLADPNLPRPLLVFVGGDADTVATIKGDIPFAVFVNPDELTWVLKHLVYKD